MTSIHFLLNQSEVALAASAGKPLLDAVRRDQGMTGCKEGCREGDCGACLVLIGRVDQSVMSYRPAAACLLCLDAVAGRHVVTIEGLNGAGLNPIQQALVEQGAIQCGYCTPGIVVALTAFFMNAVASEVDAAFDAVAGNLCRCTGYAGIKRAIIQLCRQFDLSQSSPGNRLSDCIRWQLLPGYFAGVADRLASRPGPADEGFETESAIVVAGGTDLWVQKAEAMAERPTLLLPEVDRRACVGMEAGRCRIAATTTMEQLRTSQLFQRLLPGVAEDLKMLASAPIRQQATVGGNLANASPIADLAVLFLALNADLTLRKSGTERELALRDFFLGYKQTACQAGELIQEIRFDGSEPLAGFSFEKVGKRTHLDIASVNSALTIRVAGGVIEEAHLAAGGVAPVPLYLSATCAYLRGRCLKSETVLAAVAIAQTEIAPISDLRGTADYKRLLFRQLLFAHFLKLFPDVIRWEALHVLG